MCYNVGMILYFTQPHVGFGLKLDCVVLDSYAQGQA